MTNNNESNEKLKNVKMPVKLARKYNTENIIPYNFKNIDKVKHREISRNGAKVSNKVQADKKSMKETLRLLLEIMDDETNLTEREKICLSLLKEAQKGNVRAFEVVRDTIGEKPKDRIETNLTVNIEDIIKEVQGGEF